MVYELALCNSACLPAPQYLLFAEEFAQPSITPPHTGDRGVWLWAFQGYVQELQSSHSSNYWCTVLAAGAGKKKKKTGDRRDQSPPTLGLQHLAAWHSPTTATVTLAAKEVNGAAGLSSPGPCAKILHFAQINSSLATTKGITLTLSLLT